MKVQVAELQQRFQSDTELETLIKHWTARVGLRFGNDSYVLTIAGGHVLSFAAELIDDTQLRLIGTDQQWHEQLAALPKPFWQDPLMGAMFAEGLHDPTGRFRVEGDNFDHLFPYYAAVQRIVEVLREQANGGPVGVKTLPRVERKFDTAVGRYVYVDVKGVQYRVYYEETGQGIPVLCQHTAGSDARQYRHLLEDADLQQRFRMIAYDLPYHGRSVPPTGVEWWKQDYKLHQDFLLEFVVQFSKALELDRPVFMGCSVGGFLAPDLAYYHADTFRAVIGMNSAVHFGHVEISDMTRSYSHPKLSGAWKAATMRGLIAPATPEPLRREITWCYSQSAPTVFEGDLQYYLRDHDLRGKLGEIDVNKVAVYILVGEYDRMRVSPLGSKAVADGIAGSHYEVVPQGGHFLMSENPEGFKQTIEPILSEIASARP